MAAPRGPKGSLNRKQEPHETAELRAQLRTILRNAPVGSLRAIAEAFGFRGRWPTQTMRSAAVGRAWLFKAQIQTIREVISMTRGDPERIARLSVRYRTVVNSASQNDITQ